MEALQFLESSGFATALRDARRAVEANNESIRLQSGSYRRMLAPWAQSQSLSRQRATSDVLAALRLAAWGQPSLTDAKVYEKPDPPKAAYSAAMTSPGAYFARDEKVVDSFKSLNEAIASLIDKAGSLTLVWRGSQNADWGIHSALYRRLMEINGVKSPLRHPKGKQPYPTEDQMVAAEAVILQVARQQWRFDGLSALETFARIQHAGGPTRLLDVTKNPFIAAWFAVEESDETRDADARLIAFATTPVLADPTSGGEAQIQLDEQWSDRVPPWHLAQSSTDRQSIDWGTGARRRIWVPPDYDRRILVQNAAFLLDGVPITSSRTQAYFWSNARDQPRTYWSRADLLAAASMYVKTANPNVRPRRNKRNLAPTFTFRITQTAKREIREILESRFGYSRSAIYPDVPALAQFINVMDLPTLADSGS